MKKIIITVFFTLFTIQSQASLRCSWLETKAAFTNDSMLAADQASKETFCKLGNQFMKYAQEYINECGGKSNLGMQGSSGMMINNMEIIKIKCRGYTRTVSDDVESWLNKNSNKDTSYSNQPSSLSTVSQNNMQIISPEEDSDMVEVEIKGNGEYCSLYFYSNGQINQKNCTSLTNSKGVKVYCTPRKKMCKTYREIKNLVFKK